MAAQPEFNRRRGDGNPSRVERLDALLTRLADEGAARWQARTPFSRQALTLGCYVVAVLGGLGYVALTRQYLFLGILFLAYVGSMPGRQRGALIEEIQLEAAGLPRRTLAYLAVFMLGLGLFGILSSLPFILLGALGFGSPAADLPGLVGGVAITALKVADYLARTNPTGRGGDRERPVARAGRRGIAVGKA